MKMNMFDEARTLEGMIRMCNMTQAEVAKKLGVSQSYVGNKLRLLKFSEEIQSLIIEGGLCERHARTILRLDDEERMREVIEKVKTRHLTVAECEAAVDILVEARLPRILGTAPKRERIDRFEEFLTASLKSLESMGISTKRETGYYGKKRYIMISIEEI